MAWIAIWINPGWASDITARLKHMETKLSALSDGIAAVQASLDKLATDNNQAFTDLEAAVAAGNPADIATAVSALGDINTKLQGLDAAALAADATTKPAP